MPKISPAHEHARREQILAAAIACFARQGYHATSMEDIVRESGLSVGALYTYFPSKEELFLALCDQRARQSLEHVQAIFAEPGSLEEKTRRALDYFFRELDDDLVPYARVSMEFWSQAAKSERVHRRHAEHWERMHRFYAELLATAQRSGAIEPSVDVDAAAELLIALSQGILLLHVAGMQRVSADALKAAYVRLVNRGFSTPSRAFLPPIAAPPGDATASVAPPLPLAALANGSR